MVLPPLAASILAAIVAHAGPAPLVEREAALMGTTLRVRVAAERVAGIAAIEQAFDAVRRVDGLLSTWRDDSEIARLNRAPVGAPVTLSFELHAFLREAARWSRQTAGAFDPAVGALVDAWDLRGAGRVPSPERLEAARDASGLERFGLSDDGPVAVRRDAAAWLDTGAFGKGIALREAGRALRAAGIRSALLNFGGQVMALGPEQGEEWTVPVAHPSRRTEPVLSLRLRGRSASTSSQSERSLGAGGRRIGHVLDPRSGRPVDGWGSVTVVAEDPAVADMVSTALLVMGPEAGRRWAEDRQDLGVLFLIERDGRLESSWNRALEPYLVKQSITFRRS